MGYLGYKPADKPLTSADITDSIITSAKIVDGTIANADINSSAAIALSKLSTTGTASSSNFLRGDGAWSEAGATAGQVIQVVSATDDTQRTTTSTSFVTASNTLSVTITPSSASNKILILCSASVASLTGTDFFNTTIYRNGSTNLGNGNNGFSSNRAGSDVVLYSNIGINYLDSPATTSATTYQVYIRIAANNGAINANNSRGIITVMEIKG